MASYQYRKLEPGFIRFLRIRPSQSEQLVFDITHGKLDSWTTSYVALSYRWGEPTFPCRIQIGDEHLPITQNLSDALVYIKKHYTEKFTLSSKMLWIDAICINQKDDEEKSVQVGMMHEIYNRADKVFVWLGLPLNDRTMQLAVSKLDYLKKLVFKSGRAGHSYRPWWWPYRIPSAQKERNILTGMIYKKLKNIFDVEGTDANAAWHGIVELWSNEWWSRVWVAQEATIKEPFKQYLVGGIVVHMPTPKVHFLCGRHVTHWAQLASSMFVADVLLKMPLLSLSTTFIKSSAGAHRLLRIRESRLLDRHVDLLEQLQHTRALEASNPRDKIYASLSIQTKSLFSLVRPDYSRPTLDVFLDIVRLGLQHPVPSLDFLGYAMKLDEPRRQLSQDISHDLWPSWIPNWDDPLNIAPLPKQLYKTRKKEYGRRVSPPMVKSWIQNELVPIGKAYNATRERSVSASISGYTLHVKGAIIDTIVERHSYQVGTNADRRAQMNAWYNQQSNDYPDVNDFNTVLRRTQVLDIKYHFRGQPIARGNMLNQALLDSRHADLTDEERSAQAEMKMAFNGATIYRGLALTQRGLISMVPWSARKGDCICLLIGGQVLYVLRPRDGTARQYEYIGECYVDGLMDGEALDWVEQGNSSIEDFILV